MQSRQLRQFLALYECRSFSAAADRLCVTQSALSKSIRQLEASIGVPLFERLPHGVVPTGFGDILARRAGLMQLELKYAMHEIATLRDGVSNSLSIGAGPVWISILLPPIVQQFNIQNPSVDIMLRGGAIDTFLGELIEGHLDVLCTSIDFAAHPAVIKEHLFQLQFHPVARRGHPIFDKAEPHAGDLARYPWASFAGSVINERHQQFFRSHGVPPPAAVVKSTSFLSLVRLLADGDFIAWCPEIVLSESVCNELSLVERYAMDLPVGIAYLAGRPLSEPLSEFCRLLRARFANPQTARGFGSSQGRNALLEARQGRAEKFS